MRSWSFFLSEFGLFIAGLLFVAYMALEPHMAENFVTILEGKTGFKVETGRLFFSPLGRLQGRDLLLEGKLGKEVVFVRVHQYQVEPRENLIEELWLRQENFRFEDLHYNCTLKRVTIWSRKSGRHFVKSESDVSMNWRSIDVKFGEETVVFDLEKGKLKTSKLTVNVNSLKGEWQEEKGELIVEDLSVIQKDLGSLDLERFQANVDLPEPWPIWQAQFQKAKGWSVLESISDLRCSTVVVERESGERVHLKGLRWLRRDANLWKLDAEGTVREQDILIDAQMVKKGALESDDVQWGLQGQQWLKGFWEHPIHYEVKYSPARSKLIQFVFFDVLQNRLELEGSLEKGVVVATYKARLANIPLPNQDWPSLKGELSGGASYGLSNQKLLFVMDGNGLEGGPGRTRQGKIVIKGQVDVKEKSFELSELKVEEGQAWKGEGALSGTFSPMALGSLSLRVDGFPLGQYSPKVDGILDIRANMAESTLVVDVNSPALHPDKDPLQEMKNFSVHARIDDSSVSYEQSFQQDDDTNEIVVQASVDHILEDPLKVRSGMVHVVKSKSKLFDLHLAHSVPVQLNILGVDIPHFQIEDKERRLRGLMGKAYIPFIQPSTLNIQATGELDLGRMPDIGHTKAKGIVKIEKAKWDRGWSLANLTAQWRAERLEIIPEGIIEPLLVSWARGDMFNRYIRVIELDSACGTNGRVEGSGWYFMSNKQCSFDLSAESLSYRHPQYILNYNVPDFKVRGKASSLALSGNMEVVSFNYHQDFSLLGERAQAQRLAIRPPESQDSRHQMSLKVTSPSPLSVNNNMAQLNFGIDDLLVTGVLTDLRWFGRVSALSSPTTSFSENKVRLPYQWLDISLDAKSLSLHFNGEDTWDPRIDLQSEALVDGVQVFLKYNDRMSALGEGKFKLSSSPAYSRKEILSLLGSGEEPEQEVFEQLSENEVVEEAGPALTIFKSQNKGGGATPLSYRAGVSSGEDLFELRVDYRLTPTLGVELSQTTTTGSFLGLRFSKQVDSFGEMFRRQDLKVESAKQKGASVHWHVEGTSRLRAPNFWGLLHGELEKVEPMLQKGDYEESKEQIVGSVTSLLAKQGYQNASFSIEAIRRESRSKERRGGQKVHHSEHIHILMSFELGPQLSVASCEVTNWPIHIQPLEHSWLKKGRGRDPLFTTTTLESLKENLISRCADNGYPSAIIQEVIVYPKVPMIAIPVMNSNDKVVQKDDDDGYRNRQDHPHHVKLILDPGERHRVVQLRMEGLTSFSRVELDTVLNYEDGLWYSESLISSYSKKIKQWYEAHGYFDTRVQVSQVLRSRRYPRISVRLRVEEGQTWRVGQISMTGLKRSSPDDLFPVLGLSTGDKASPLDMELAIQRVSKCPQILSVDVKWGDLVDGFRDLIIHLEEVPSWRLSTRLGFESDTGLQWAFRLRRENLKGKGHVASVDSNFSSQERHVIFRYTVPNVLKREWKGNWILGEQVKLISSDEIKNNSVISGFSLSRERTLSHWVSDLTYREDDNVDGRFPTLRLKSIYRKTSQPLPKQPGYGWGWTVESQLAAYLDRNRYAYLGEYRLSYGFKLGGSVMTPWARLGHKWSPGSQFDLPLADRFFVGGTGSLRGFADDAIGGKVKKGGESMTSFGAELFYPIEDWVDGSLFYEWGRVYDRSSFSKAGTKGHSIGMGLLFRTPVGPIQGFFAHPLGEDRLGSLGLQLGTIF